MKPWTVMKAIKMGVSLHLLAVLVGFFKKSFSFKRQYMLYTISTI